MPSLYQEVLNHLNTSDELRRSTEAKLIVHKQKYFYALPTTSSEKATLGKELDELVEGVVVIGVPDELSWSMFLEGKDTDTIGLCLISLVQVELLRAVIVGYGLDHLRQYMRLLPATPLARLLEGYFLYTGTPLEVDEDDDGEEHPRKVVDDRDPFDIIMVGFIFETSQPLSSLARKLLVCCPLRS